MSHFTSQPLPSSFMLIGMIGFLVSAIIVWPQNVSWGFSLSVLFGIFCIAAVIDFTHAESDEALDIHNSKKYIP